MSPTSNRAAGTWARASSTIFGATSYPVTSWPAAASSSAVGRPVPAPRSSTFAFGGRFSSRSVIASRCPVAVRKAVS
jgi:hypothetical protein